MYQTLQYNVEEHIATITLNRPKAGNAIISGFGFQELGDAFDQADADVDVKVVILTGAGKNFCAGGDISDFRERIANKTYITDVEVRTAGNAARSIRKCSKPTIAAINGACAGAGLSIALACDMRVMASNGILSMAFIRMALSGDTGGIYNLLRLTGLGKTMEYIMLGDNISPQEAHQFGLVNRIVEPEQLEVATTELACRLVNGPSQAYTLQKQLVWNWLYADYPVFTEKEIEAFCLCCRTEDFNEAVEAFLTKRNPQFSGK